MRNRNRLTSIHLLVPGLLLGGLSLGAVTVADASFINVGEPLPSTSWVQRFEAVTDDPGATFDSFSLDLLTDGGAGPFESPWLTNFDATSWNIAGTPEATAVEAGGPAAATLAFDVHFDGDMSSPVSFFFTSYSGDQGLERVLAQWNGEQWNFLAANLNDTAGEPVPEPATLLLSGLGLAMAAGGRLARRRRGNRTDA